jgi:hypothetical protein
MYRSGMGDYRYRRMLAGDPGFLSGLGHALGGIAKVGLGFVTGGPLGAAKAAFGVAKGGIERETLAAGGGGSALTPELRARHVAALARGTASAPIGSSLAGTPHGRLSRGAGAIGPPGENGKKRRRMNWANHYALGRAERRIHSAVKHMSKYIRWVHPRKEGHAAPKFGGHHHAKKRRKAA